MPTARWEERIGLLNPDCFKYVAPNASDRRVEVRETAEDGKASVMFEVPRDRHGILLGLTGEKSFPYLADRKNADGYLLIEQADRRSWAGHVVECKKRITAKSWPKAQEQIRPSLVRLQILADFLGIAISEWVAWIAYQEETLSLANSPDPTMLRLPTGAPDPLRAAPRPGEPMLSWAAGTVDGGAMSPSPLPCRRIQLDSKGNGTQAL